ncbi:RNA polymerase I-specific transcription initiation factor rrn7 [Grifola frondosa]|uniref:RNA polymerase I-specific transcription initiation factor rrn7 n=1 Tax=Grifola frondosa TaxID=5627 RepID=A0A1C7M1V4_GRIFR|nr:RNA polymerase I-specific transcription initiation factor rrn7 [Grifola frondosa]
MPMRATFFRNETTEVTELGPHAVRKRALKSGRKRKLKLSKADPMLYHGERARYHYFECMQLVLRMQVSSLIKLWGLPSEFETVCRDIWALHLALLPSPPPAEPLNHAKDEAGDQAQDILSPPPDDTPPGENHDNTFKDEDDIEDAMSEYSSSSSGEEDAEMADLMRENSEISSSSGEEESDQAQPRVKGTRRKRLYRKYDAPASNIAVLILACWTLRLPVMYMDFVRLIEAYELPYLDPVRLLPVSLTRHLTKHTTHALSPHHAPTPIHLHRLCARLAKLLNSSYGVHMPELNAAPVLWRAVRSLCGTPTLYMLAKKLARVISIPLSLHRSLVPALTRAKTRDSSWHKHDDAIPEVAIAAAVIIVLKMVYGLDGKPRQPSQKDDPACALPRLSEYLLALRECEQAATSKEELFSATSQWSVLDMTEPMIDQYLQFCEKALLPEKTK